MKRFLVPILVVVLLIALVVPAHAAWSEKITGGGQAVFGSGINETSFSITVSAWETDEGYAAGQMQYSRVGQYYPDLSVHAKVQCVGIHEDSTIAIVAGPVDVQYDPAGQVEPDDWMVVEILEGGVGSGDRVRVRFMSEADARYVCDYPSGIFPGLIYDGNFNIRSK